MSRASLVVSDSSNLSRSDRIPYEVFPTSDFPAHGGISASTVEALEKAGLADIFTAEPGCNIGAFTVEGTRPKTATLLFKFRIGQHVETLEAFCEERKTAMADILHAGRTTAGRYQWEILRNVLWCTEPCIITDPDGRIVSVNALFCQLVGVNFDDLIGYSFQEFIHLQEDIANNIANFPAHEEIITPLYVKTQSLFFMSDIGFSRLRTLCGDRFIYAFRDLMTDQRTGNSNIQFVQKLSSMIMAQDSPQAILRKLINVLTLTLDADLVCVLKKNEKGELVITPYSNRRLETLRVAFIEPNREPVLEAYFKHGTPIFCEDVEGECAEDSFFRRVLPLSRFAFIPAGHDRRADHTLLVAWIGAGAAINIRSLPLFRIVANLVGAVLAHATLLSQIGQEKQTLQRYANLTAGRELRMARLKHENAQLRELVKKLSEAMEG
jgi:PAS domain-containing protein